MHMNTKNIATIAVGSLKSIVDQVVAKSETIILGKEHQIRLALCCLLARGHLLIEDLPGVGKTVLAHVLAKTLGLAYQRIQLLPIYFLRIFWVFPFLRGSQEVFSSIRALFFLR